MTRPRITRMVQNSTVGTAMRCERLPTPCQLVPYRYRLYGTSLHGCHEVSPYTTVVCRIRNQKEPEGISCKESSLCECDFTIKTGKCSRRSAKGWKLVRTSVVWSRNARNLLVEMIILNSGEHELVLLWPEPLPHMSGSRDWFTRRHVPQCDFAVESQVECFYKTIFLLLATFFHVGG